MSGIKATTKPGTFILHQLRALHKLWNILIAIDEFLHFTITISRYQ